MRFAQQFGLALLFLVVAAVVPVFLFFFAGFGCGHLADLLMKTFFPEEEKENLNDVQ